VQQCFTARLMEASASAKSAAQFGRLALSPAIDAMKQ
jgi:hypothetical protein